MTTIKAINYLDHIKPRHMLLTGRDLAFYNVPCPTCQSKLVKRNKQGTDILFVACDKINRAFCPFTIGMEETLAERTHRIYNKLRHKDVIDAEFSFVVENLNVIMPAKLELGVSMRGDSQ